MKPLRLEGRSSLVFHNFNKIPEGSKFREGGFILARGLRGRRPSWWGMHWGRAPTSVVEGALHPHLWLSKFLQSEGRLLSLPIYMRWLVIWCRQSGSGGKPSQKHKPPLRSPRPASLWPTSCSYVLSHKDSTKLTDSWKPLVPMQEHVRSFCTQTVTGAQSCSFGFARGREGVANSFPVAHHQKAPLPIWNPASAHKEKLSQFLLALSPDQQKTKVIPEWNHDSLVIKFKSLFVTSGA